MSGNFCTALNKYLVGVLPQVESLIAFEKRFHIVKYGVFVV